MACNRLSLVIALLSAVPAGCKAKVSASGDKSQSGLPTASSTVPADSADTDPAATRPPRQTTVPAAVETNSGTSSGDDDEVDDPTTTSPSTTAPGASDSSATTTTLPPILPALEITGPTSGATDVPYEFAAAVTGPGNYAAGAFTYAWSVTELPPSKAKVIRRMFPSPGTYRVAVTAKDADGNVLTAQKDVVVTARPTPAPLRTLYVDGGGDDANSGLSLAAAFKTLQKAADVAVPGDLVLVSPGDYAGFIIGFDKPARGTMAAPIEFRAAAPGVRVVAGSPETSYIGVRTSPDTAWMTIKGFEFVCQAGTFLDAVRFEQSSYMTVANAKVTGCDHSIEALNSHVSRVLDSEISLGVIGLRFTDDDDFVVLRGSYIHDMSGIAYHTGPTTEYGSDMKVYGHIVEGNRFINNVSTGGGAFNCAGNSDMLVRNNLFVNVKGDGFRLFSTHPDPQVLVTPENVVVVQNTFVMGALAGSPFKVYQPTDGLVIAGNIMMAASASGGALNFEVLQPQVQLAHNVYSAQFIVTGAPSDLAAWRAAVGGDATSIVAAPAAVFVDPAADFRLKTGSAATGAGSSPYLPKTDLTGALRTGADAGCYAH